MLDPLSRHKSMLIEFSISPIFLGKISKNARRRSFEIERLFQIKEWSFQIERRSFLIEERLFQIGESFVEIRVLLCIVSRSRVKLNVR